MPSATSVGKRISEPPPAIELMPPARRATPATMSRSTADTSVEPTVGALTLRVSAADGWTALDSPSTRLPTQRAESLPLETAQGGPVRVRKDALDDGMQVGEGAPQLRVPPVPVYPLAFLEAQPRQHLPQRGEDRAPQQPCRGVVMGLGHDQFGQHGPGLAEDLEAVGE